MEGKSSARYTVSSLLVIAGFAGVGGAVVFQTLWAIVFRAILIIFGAILNPPSASSHLAPPRQR